jgi:hypothetical protein
MEKDKATAIRYKTIFENVSVSFLHQWLFWHSEKESQTLKLFLFNLLMLLIVLEEGMSQEKGNKFGFSSY